MKDYKLLLIDDEAEQCEHFEMVFKSFGYNVTTFMDPKRAYIEAILNEPFHVIFIDDYMPFINGVKLLNMIRESNINKNSYVIAYSSEPDRTMQEQIFESGFDDIIVKPMDEKIVNIKLKAIIKRYFKDQKINDEKNPFKAYSNYDYTLNGIRMNLTPNQYDIFKILFENMGKILSSKDIFSAISRDPCSDCADNPTDCIRKQMAKIKDKIKRVDSNKKYIITLLQKGYKLTF